MVRSAVNSDSHPENGIPWLSKIQNLGWFFQVRLTVESGHESKGIVAAFIYDPKPF
jgi:hypothetical protein